MQASEQHRHIAEHASSENKITLVTMWLDKQRFGIPVQYVRDVLREQRIAFIPKAPTDIMGSINLRGRIVTVLNMREKLQLESSYSTNPMFVVVEFQGEYFSLLVDAVGEVLTIDQSQIEAAPSNVESNWREVSSGICQLHNDLLVVIDAKMLLAE
jgi:purine-binding chemotaxis protein CheW